MPNLRTIIRAHQRRLARGASLAAAVTVAACVAVAIASEPPQRRPLWGVGAFALGLAAVMFYEDED